MRIKKLKRNFEKLTKEKARIIAHLIGDGCIFKTGHDYVMKYEVIDTELLDSFERDMIHVYGLDLGRGVNPSGKTGKLISFVRLRSKLVFDDLQRYATYFSRDWEIKEELLKAPKQIQKEFLTAMFDDEGTVVRYGNRLEIRLYSINQKGLRQVEKMLQNFDISCRMASGYGLKRNVFALVIKNPTLFKKAIGFGLRRKQMKL